MSVGPFSIGPRVGVNYTHLNIDSYSEEGGTGLELRFESEDVDSFQTVVGAQASVALRFDSAVVVPQIFGDWTHEFENDQSRRSVRFVQDGRPNPKSFTYQTEKPDRNYGISAAVSPLSSTTAFSPLSVPKPFWATAIWTASQSTPGCR